MARNEDGEMELVLGNKQLLSVLFILVVLLGVFFTMGYIVGRNNPSEEKIQVAAAKRQAAIAGKSPGLTIDSISGTPNTKPSPTSTETPSGEQPPTVEPARKEAPKKETSKPEEKKEIAKKEEPKKDEPKKKEDPKPEPSRTVSGELFQSAPTPGEYLQVAAIDKPGATGMAEAYRKQGFATYIAPSSSPTLFRVIIGPFKTKEEVANAKIALKKIGVEGAILRKF